MCGLSFIPGGITGGVVLTVLNENSIDAVYIKLLVNAVPTDTAMIPVVHSYPLL
jgi:hypothetical protein